MKIVKIFARGAWKENGTSLSIFFRFFPVPAESADSLSIFFGLFLGLPIRYRYDFLSILIAKKKIFSDYV